MAEQSLPLRQIHLDFHNAPTIPDIGADWDADRFVATLRGAHVQSVTLFAKCHHGMSYYPTAVGRRHPALTFDLLGAQLDACRAEGIRCPVYLSVMWDVAAAEAHPEWRVIDTAGKQVSTSGEPFEAGWPFLCVNTPYADELAAQVEELIDRYAPEGFFLDILFYPAGTCICVACLGEMRRAGRDPRDAADRQAHTLAVARRFMGRISGQIRAKLPKARIFYNSRWGLTFAGEAEHYSQVEVEALPTGGWGYGFYPLWARHARLFGLPMLGMTGRFHRSWADWGGLKHPDALRYECGSILSAGGAISVGDQLHPRGRLNRAVYEAIGAAFADVAAVEPYCLGARPAAQIGLLTFEEPTRRAEVGGMGGSLEGAGKMLLELHHQFDVITPATADFAAYELLVIPDQGVVTPGVRERLRAFVEAGGRLLLSHQALLDQSSASFALAELLGVDYLGLSPSHPDYFVLSAPALHGPVTRPDFAYSLYEGPTIRVAARPGTELLAETVESYFNRTWDQFSSHEFTAPRAEPSGRPAITHRGGIIYIYGPIFGAYQRHGNPTFRELIGGCVRLLLPAPLVSTDAPPTADVTLCTQGSRQIVHLVNYHASRRAPAHVEALEAPVPLRDVRVWVRRSRPVGRVVMGHDGSVLPFEQTAEGVSVVVPIVRSHALVVIDEP